MYFYRLVSKRMRCFQCGNSLLIKDKKSQERYPEYNIEKLHAHFYPTCEWVKEILGIKYVTQVLYDRVKISKFYFSVFYFAFYCFFFFLNFKTKMNIKH